MGLFVYTQKGSKISTVDLPTTEIIEPKKIVCRTILNRTPKVRQKKSNIWGAIFMKLSYEDKIEIYELRQSG
ncbi:hypothetical protein RFK55_11430, partial [Streptococcus suis]